VTILVTGLRVLSPEAPPGAARRWADILAPASIVDKPTAASAFGAIASRGGDIAGAPPIAALRARIARKLAATRDAYLHLVGWGMAPRRGSLLSATELAAIQLRATRDLLADPDIATADVAATLSPAGVHDAVMFRVRVTTRTGLTDDFTTSGGT